MGNSPQQTGWSTSDLQADPHGNAGKAEKVSDMFTAIASHYDLNNRLHSLGRDQAWRRALVKRASVKPSDRILDIACGTGDLTEAFARSNPTSVTGINAASPRFQEMTTLEAELRQLKEAVYADDKKTSIGLLKKVIPEFKSENY